MILSGMLTYDLILGLFLFVVSTSITPGPNNIMLMTSGVNFGVQRSLPHLFGVGLGFAAMVRLVGLGLGRVFELYPQTNTWLRAIGAAYLLYLAFKIATSGEAKDGAAGAQPLSFLQAAAFQWVNPKGWVMATGAIVGFTVSEAFVASLAVVLGFWILFGTLCSGTWLAFGAAMRRFLK